MTDKICKKCGFQGNKNDFKGRSCKICYREARRVPSISIRICKSCGLEKELKFRIRLCCECIELSKQNTILKERAGAKKYYYKHQAEVLTKMRKNRDKIRPIRNAYRNSKRESDPIFSLQEKVSNSIRDKLKKIGKSKNRKSTIKFLPYTIQELKEHLEKQFESWMAWDNHSTYRISSWCDNDPTTWTWQIDHIIPHSTFHYTSMEDGKFQKCWALKNLRPLGAKQNILKGNR